MTSIQVQQCYFDMPTLDGRDCHFNVNLFAIQFETQEVIACDFIDHAMAC